MRNTETRTENNAVKAVSYMMIITLIGKVLGLVRDMLLASNYGAGMQSDAFFTASRIPRIFFDAMFASAISASFIPVFNEYLQKKGKEEAYRFSNVFITLIILITFLITAIGMGFAQPLAVWFAPGFDAKTSALCAQLLVILFPTVVFTGIAYAFVGILQSLDEFTIPAALSIVSNGIIILYYLFFNKTMGVFGLAVAFLIGWAMQAVMQLPSLKKKGYRYRPSFQFKDEGLKKVMLLMLPVMVSTWVQPINVVINTKFASRLYQGVSSIEYANNLYTIIVGVFVLSVANVIFPRLSRLMSDNNKEQFSQVLLSTIKTLSFIIIPMTVGLMLLSTPIVRLIFERGKFDASASHTTSMALMFFSIGMLGFGLQTILSRAYYAMQDGKTPLIAGGISIIANFVLCFLLVDTMKTNGLALASSISSTLFGLILFFAMHRKYKIISKKFIFEFMKMLICAALMAAAVIPSMNILTLVLGEGLISRVLIVGVPTLVGLITYMVFAIIFKIDEALLAVSFAKSVLKRK